MWNVPLANGIPLTVATGCVLVLFGISVGLVIAAMCWVCIAVSADQQALAPQESYASISDDEIEIVIELVHDALATGGWTLCGDCYTRNLLQRLQLPVKELLPLGWEQSIMVPASTRRVNGGKHPVQKIDLSSWLGWASWWEASLDMGSGITTIYVQPVKATTRERTERGPLFRLSFPSVVGTGEHLLETIANGRNAPRDKAASILSPGEFVLRMQHRRYQHLVGRLADLEGEHPTDAKGDPDRYWGEHIKIVACTAITRYGNPTGNNVSIDVGDRTTEIIFAKGCKLVSRDSEGRTYGVRQVIENIIAEINTQYGRGLEVEEVRVLLKAYTAGVRLPRLKVAKGTPDGYLDGGAQREIIARKVTTMARALATFVRAALNREGAEIGSNLDTATIYGGRGYLFYGPLKNGIPGDSELGNGVLHDLYLPDEAEYLNAAYMQELVGQQTILKPTMWERRR